MEGEKGAEEDGGIEREKAVKQHKKRQEPPSRRARLSIGSSSSRLLMKLRFKPGLQMLLNK